MNNNKPRRSPREKYNVSDEDGLESPGHTNIAYISDNVVPEPIHGRYLNKRGHNSDKRDSMFEDVSFAPPPRTPGVSSSPKEKKTWSTKNIRCRDVILIVLGCVLLLGLAIGTAVGVILSQQESFKTTPSPPPPSTTTPSDQITYVGTLRLTQPWPGTIDSLNQNFSTEIREIMKKSPLNDSFISATVNNYSTENQILKFSLEFSRNLIDYVPPTTNATETEDKYVSLIESVIEEGETTLPINVSSIIIIGKPQPTTIAPTTKSTSTTTMAPTTKTTTMSLATSTTTLPQGNVTTDSVELTTSSLTSTGTTQLINSTDEPFNTTTDAVSTTSLPMTTTTNDAEQTSNSTTAAPSTNTTVSTDTTDMGQTSNSITAAPSINTTVSTTTAPTAATTTKPTRCVYQDYDLCHQFGNKFTLLPNFFYDQSIESAVTNFQLYFNSTIESGCSRDSLFFFCNFVFPQCEEVEGTEVAIYPCGSVCEDVTTSCDSNMPFPLDCQYPGYNSTQCVSPKQVDMTTPSPETCHRVDYEFCNEEDFNETALPTLFSYTMEGTISVFKKFALATVARACSPLSKFFYCGLFFPKCDNGNITLPCRSVCEAIDAACSDIWVFPIDCEATFNDTDCLMPPEDLLPTTTIPTTTTSISTTPSSTTTIITTTPGERCEVSTTIDICQSFGIFNNTFYPNQWNFNSERDAIEKGYNPYGLRSVSSGCSNSTLFYLCSVLFPPCDGQTIRKPCKDVCLDVATECKDLLFPQPCDDFADDSPNCLRPPAQKVCANDEFSCHGSQQCIPNSSVCDGSMDCTDWSDERNCVCNEYQFKCDMGMCIKNYQQCDKVGDCPDSSDELNCTCPLGRFTCNDGKCIMPEWVCDNQRDCLQNEDEANCPSCVDGQFRCLSGECILARNRCDGTPQCGDQSDERQCIIEVSESYPFLLSFDDWLPVCATNFTDELADLTCRKFGNLAAVNWTSVAYTYYMYAHIDPVGDTTSIIGNVTLRSTCPGDRCVFVNCEPRGCGQRAKTIRNTIVNGENAQPGVWPWQVSMQRIGKHYCGGSLISPNFVVTAAHCIEQYKLEFSFIDIVLGATKLTSKESMQVKRKIKRLVLHNHIFHERNDIALIQLSRPVEYTDYIRPICLPDATETFTRSNQCFAVGWGMKAWNTTFSNRLQEAKMTLWDTQKCNSSLAWNGAVGDTFICAGYYSGFISTCNGDSGGSLVCQANDYNWYLVGISSYVAKGCNVKERPVVFSDAQFFTPWIQNHTQCIFTCDNGHCIYDANQLCNRENDCGDNSDEIKPCSVSVNCTFDDPFLCGYDVSWDRLTATDFVNHYPLYDHTVGSYPGFYMVGRARGLLLTTPRFTAKANTCLRFFYHMRGDIAGGIQVWFNQYFPDGTDTWEPVFKKKDVTMPDKWQMGQFDLKDGEFEIIFLTNVASRVAIDDVMILNQSCASADCSSDEMQCGTGIDKQCIDKRSRCNLVTDCPQDEDEVNCGGSSYFCDFDDPVLCGLEQATTDNELVEWRVVNSSKTPGAFKDHSYTDTGNMLVMETRSLLKDKEVFMTQSLYLGGETHCFQFYYYSDTTGTLEISYRDGNSTVKNILWVVSNRITVGWAKTQFTLPALDTIHLTYNMIGGSFDGTYRPFLALDDLNITRGQCPKFECGDGLVACSEENYCLPETSYCNRKVDCVGGSDEVTCVCKSTEYKCPGGPCIDRSLTCDRVYHCADHSDEGDICDPLRQVSCDFEHPFLCGYRFESTDYKWRRYFGKTTTFGTGPSADHTYKNISGHYVYADGSEGRYSALTHAESPKFNATGKSLSFYYHLFSILASFNSNTGSLMLIVKDYNLGQNYTLLAEVPTQENKWKHACVDLPPSDSISLVFVAQRGDDLLADDKAIDDIVLQDGRCKSTGVTGETSPPLFTDTTPT
ncbi:hypothetical protein SNE40_006301 [Patella caerulea]|uniref:Acrosin n=1 Tax=Patella caerulea TaxID=87958 RepID=A0AAN8K784_PATCE